MSASHVRPDHVEYEAERWAETPLRQDAERWTAEDWRCHAERGHEWVERLLARGREAGELRRELDEAHVAMEDLERRLADARCSAECADAELTWMTSEPLGLRGEEPANWVRPGAVVRYQPGPGASEWHLGVVVESPRRLDGHTWTVRLTRVGAGYHEGRGSVPAAALSALRWTGGTVPMRDDMSNEETT